MEKSKNNYKKETFFDLVKIRQKKIVEILLYLFTKIFEKKGVVLGPYQNDHFFNFVVLRPPCN